MFNTLAKLAAVRICAKVFRSLAIYPTAHQRTVAGEELQAFLERHEQFDRVVYVGDGTNDFCPILRLRRFVRLGIDLRELSR